MENRGRRLQVILVLHLIIYLVRKRDMMSDQILSKIKADLEKQQTISKTNLQQLKKVIEQYKSSQKPQDVVYFKQKIIGLCLVALENGKPSQADKIAILELLQRELISSKHNSNLFNKLYNYLVQDDENVATQASKAIDSLIKQINEKSQITPGAIPLDVKQHYIKLFQFLRERTDFLLNLSHHVKDPDFKMYKRKPYDGTKQGEMDQEKKDIVFKNTKSLKFINQVPQMFVHLMAYAELDTKANQQDKKIKDLIKESIDNLIQSLRKTPYLQFYNQFNFQFNNQLFGVMTKLLQFLFITLRNQKQDKNISQNLRKHINQQIEFIKVPEVIKNFIYLLKNCSEEFRLNRYEIVNRLKLLLCSLDQSKLSRADAMDILGELFNQETIYGKKKLLGDYSKNKICSYWIEIIKSDVLFNNVFYIQFLDLPSVAQSGLSEQNPQINNCFLNIYKLLQQVFKTMFDNTIYPSIQQKCIQFLNLVVEQLFPQTGEHASDLSLISTSAIAKKVHENKLKILIKILQSASLKFQSIKNIFEEIDVFLTKKLGRKVTKEDLPEPSKLKHMQLNSLDISVAETPNFSERVVDFIQKYDQKIDDSLLTVITIPNKFLTIYEQQDELCFNSHPVKSTNFTLYMREVKTKLIQKTIHLAHRLTKTFLTQNIESYTQAQFQSLKSIYHTMPTNKKALTSEQCSILSTILKNGLKVFQILHNYDLHTDQQTNKKGHLKNFMLIFAQIYDPVNFRDIFEPNMQEFFRNLIKYAKYCADYCLQFVLIEPFCTRNQDQPYNKNIVELLLYNLILRLQSTPDILDPFHQFYDYKQQYFSLLQKLIRFPFRCLSRYSDDSFIRNYFRQIILILIKKAHTSRFCLDYLHLMRTLFKNILFNCNRDTASPLFSEFYAICSKSSHTTQPHTTPHSIFVNVNVLQNFMKLYQTGIPELADIVTELIIMLPLKSKHIIHFAKQGYIVKPLLHCLCLMSDYNYTLRTLKIFEIIISYSNAEEINSFLDGVKDKLIDRLYFIANQQNITDLNLGKNMNNLSPLSLKLLTKLGCISNDQQLPIQMKFEDQQDKQVKLKQLELVYSQLKTHKTFTISMVDAIEYAIQIFHKILDPLNQSIVFITMDMIEQCFALLKEVLPLTLMKMHQLSERIISIFCNILSLSSKYITISQSILSHIREEVRVIIRAESEKITSQLTNFGLNQYCKFFIKCLITNLSERVLITRQDNFIKQISEQPKRFIWQLIKNMLAVAQKTTFLDSIYQYIIRMLISQIIMIKNPQHIQINNFQSEYNHVLPFKNAALNCLNEIINTTSPAVLDETKGDIIQAIFIVVTTVPDILNLKIMQHPIVIANKIYTHMLKDQKEFVKFLQTESGDRILTNIIENLVSYSSEAHKIAKLFLTKIMDETDLNLVQILYGGLKWQQIIDKSSPSFPYIKNQSKYTLDALTSGKQVKKCPIVYLAKNLVKISFNVNEQQFKSNPKMRKMLSNAFLTYELLINIRHKEEIGMGSQEVEEKIYHAFCILGKCQDTGEFVEASADFDKNFQNVLRAAHSIIEINANLYGNYTKVANEQRPVINPPTNLPSTNSNFTNPSPTAPTSYSFNINPNTFIDDQQYGLNVEDFDMEIKSWSQLISSILKFQKSVLFNDTIFQLSKNLQKSRLKAPIVQKRTQIIFNMFDLIGRVQRNVRQTACDCIKELLSKQEHPKDLFQSDQKLRRVIRPALISLQLDFKKFTPSFLHMFRKILELLTQWFDLSMVAFLIDKIRQIYKSKYPQHYPQPYPQAPQQQSTCYPNLSEIMLEVKCIAGFLELFEHLAYALNSHRSDNYAANTLILIFKYVACISQYYIPKLGKHTVMKYLYSALAKVFNKIPEKISGEIIVDNAGSEQDLDFDNLLQIIKMKQSYPFRQKLTRETAYIQKAFINQTKNSNKKDYLTFLQIIVQLAIHNNRWLKNMHQFAQKLLKQLNYAIQDMETKTEMKTGMKMETEMEMETQKQEVGDKNQVILLSRILLEYVKQNKEEIECLFGLVNLFKLRVTFDLNFIRMYLKYELYYNISPETRRRIFIQYFKMYQDPIKYHDTDKILAISQYIIYEFILIQLSLPQPQRSILTKNDEIIKQAFQTIKQILNPNLLHNPNTFRQAIQILQISNLMMKALKNLVSVGDWNWMGWVVWELVGIEDRIVRGYAYVWLSTYVGWGHGLGQSQVLELYSILIREFSELEELGHGDQEFGVLIKKALNILTPYWDKKAEQSNNLVMTNQSSTQSKPNQSSSQIKIFLEAIKNQSTQPQKKARLWQIIIKNNQIFNKFKQPEFLRHMINSMQWIMVTTNSTPANAFLKKIAIDMSFVYIEWKFKDVREKIMTVGTMDKKIQILGQDWNQAVAEICLNFFIKTALKNCYNKDDHEIMKRSLYLLKKTLILWPNTKKKFKEISYILMNRKSPGIQATESPCHFHYALLNIINSLILYESDKNLLPQLSTIFNLIQLADITPKIVPAQQQSQQQQQQQQWQLLQLQRNSIFAMHSMYLVHLFCGIVRRLLMVAAANPMDEESIYFIEKIHGCVKDGFDFYVLTKTNRNNRLKQQQSNQAREPGQRKISIQIAISFLKTMFEIDPKFAEPHLNNIKQVAIAQKKKIERDFQAFNKSNNLPLFYEPPPLTQGTFQQMLNKDLEINIQLVQPEVLVQAEQNYEKDIMKSYLKKRLQLVILLRILASRINVNHDKDQGSILQIFRTVYQKIPDPQLKIQVINILKCLLIGKTAFADNQIPYRYQSIPLIEQQQRKIFYLMFSDKNKFSLPFQKRKIDSNLSLNQVLYEQITAKLYSDFLSKFPPNLKYDSQDYSEMQEEQQQYSGPKFTEQEAESMINRVNQMHIGMMEQGMSNIQKEKDKEEMMREEGDCEKE